MLTSSSSPTEKMIGSTSSYSRSCHMNIFARSFEYTNWRSGLPVPATTNGVPFSDFA